MTRRRWLWAAALVFGAALAYGGYRLFIHSSHVAEPAILTPSMDAQHMLSPSLGARIDRVLHDRVDYDRTGRPKLIALTFDDGPYPRYTPLLLARLHDLHVPATFFLIGRDAEQWPELTARIRAQGNEIADHTYSHPNLDAQTRAQVQSELLRGSAVLWSLTRDPAAKVFFRPPHGRYTIATIRAAQALGYKVILWNDDGGDWRARVTAAQLTAHLEAHATAPDIVLLHSGSQATIDMLGGVVARFRAAGYRFVTVGQLLDRVAPADVNHPAKHAI